MSVKLLTENHLKFLSLKEAAQAHLSYTCRNTTLLEIICHGSNESLSNAVIPVLFHFHACLQYKKKILLKPEQCIMGKTAPHPRNVM